MSERARLEKLSQRLARIAVGLMIALPTLIVVVWLKFDVFGAGLVSDLGLTRDVPPFDQLTPTQIGLGMLAMMLPAAAMICGLWHLRKLLLGFSAGRIFTAENVAALKAFAWSVVAAILLDIVSASIIGVVLTWNNLPGHRELVIGVSSNQVLSLFAGAVFALIAHVMDVGRSLAAENAEFL